MVADMALRLSGRFKVMVAICPAMSRISVVYINRSPLSLRAEHERILREFQWSFRELSATAPGRCLDRRPPCEVLQGHPRWRYCPPDCLRQRGSRQARLTH